MLVVDDIDERSDSTDRERIRFGGRVPRPEIGTEGKVIRVADDDESLDFCD